jgi:hypothetical protein
LLESATVLQNDGCYGVGHSRFGQHAQAVVPIRRQS